MEKFSCHTSLETSVSTKVDMVEGVPRADSRVLSLGNDHIDRIYPHTVRSQRDGGATGQSPLLAGVRSLAASQHVGTAIKSMRPR